MEARNRDLSEWFERIKRGQLALPRFQRYETWDPKAVRSLLESVVTDLPAGAALVLESAQKPVFVSRGLSGAPAPAQINELLLDGQQRLTALWRSFHDDYNSRTFLLDLSGDEPTVHLQGRWLKDGRRFPLWTDDPADCWSRSLVPVSLLAPGEIASNELDDWIKQAIPDDLEQRFEIRDRLREFRRSIQHYKLPYLFLPISTPPHTALTVFIKMNTGGVKLSPFDIIVAQTEEAAGESLHDLVDAIEGQAPGIGSYEDPRDLVLAAAALLQGKPPTSASFLSLSPSILYDDLPRITEGLSKVVPFLRQEGVPDGSRLPTNAVLAPLACLFTTPGLKSDQLGELQTTLRKFCWRAFLTDRYESSASTKVYQDYKGLVQFIAGNTDAEIPVFRDDLHGVPAREEILQAGWPKKRDRLARAILCLSLRGGATDFADAEAATPIHVTQREYHHLFPVAWLRDAGVSESDAFRALNCALITWRTNRVIGAKAPLDYLTERAQNHSLGEPEIRRRLRTHAINFDDLKAGDYEQFRLKRARELADAALQLAEGIAWTPR